ncbi:pyrroline-5-carboxylate reductase [Compostimonas suwonensis]|uniref:pyrroline-5-carboxylate reductase n=1 Tax=Compostimonas suwonensis TaxID=1048394 RepID=UPI000C247331|nr:pyrroline-5-carboxylate reductase [Compostimonas suwonensis]
MTVELPSISILGAGSMGRAILSGLVRPGVIVSGGIRVTNRGAKKAAELSGLRGVTALSTEQDAGANLVAVAGARVVLVAVKPYMVPDLLDEIAGALMPGAIVVSVAAGVTVQTFESHLPESVRVIRSMPNTPAFVGKAVTGVSPGTRSDDDDLAVVTALFGTVGDVVVVPESQLDALSAISGSGPAYVFYLIEQLTAAAIDKGFTPEQARLLVNGTFLGASELLVSSGEEPAELRRKVTSPGGTTERAIAELEKAGLKQLFDTATSAALARSGEMAAGN